MLDERQYVKYSSLMAATNEFISVSERTNRAPFGGDLLHKIPLTPHVPTHENVYEFGNVGESVSGFRGHRSRKQAPPKLDNPNSMLSIRKADGFPQLLLAAIDSLAGVTEDQLLTSLTADDHQRLVASLDKLIGVIGKNENHFLAPLMDFISDLIEKCGEEFNMKEELTRDEAEYTLDMLIAVNPDYEDASEEWGYRLSLPDSNPETACNDADILWYAKQPTEMENPETACNDADPEYTLDMLIAVNPDYEDASEEWEYE